MNRLFFLLMAGSSALALLRGFILAGILPIDGFGLYASVFATGTFAASLLSFGMIERSFKRFPRLFVDGHMAAALDEADRIARKLGLRAAFTASIFTVVLLLLNQAEWLLPALLASGVAFGVGAQSTYISLQRAEGDLTQIGAASLARALLSLLLGASGALIIGWWGALIGEIAGGLLGGLASRHFIWSKVKFENSRGELIPAKQVAAEQRELWTFLGFLGAGIPLYLDRSIVMAMLGQSAAGTYAVLMLFVVGTYSLTSIVSQKLGPQLVRMQRSGSATAAQLWLLGQWTAGIASIGFFGVLFAGWIITDGPLSLYAARYNVNSAMFLAAATLAALQVTHLSEWFLLAHDQERGVFTATLVLLVSLTMAVAFAAYDARGIIDILWLFACAKAVQLATLILLAVRVARRDQTRECAEKVRS